MRHPKGIYFINKSLKNINTQLCRLPHLQIWHYQLRYWYLGLPSLYSLEYVWMGIGTVGLVGLDLCSSACILQDDTSVLTSRQEVSAIVVVFDYMYGSLMYFQVPYLCWKHRLTNSTTPMSILKLQTARDFERWAKCEVSSSWEYDFLFVAYLLHTHNSWLFVLHVGQFQEIHEQILPRQGGQVKLFPFRPL